MLVIGCHRITVIVATAAGAKHIVPDGTAGDSDFCFLGHDAILTTAVHIALDGGSVGCNCRIVLADGYRRVLHHTQGRPQRIDRAIEQGETAHGTAEHIATRGMIGVGKDSFLVVTDGTAGDVDGDIAVIGAVQHSAVFGIVRRNEVGTYRSQTTTAIDRTQHGTAVDVHIHIAGHDT